MIISVGIVTTHLLPLDPSEWFQIILALAILTYYITTRLPCPIGLPMEFSGAVQNVKLLDDQTPVNLKEYCLDSFFGYNLAALEEMGAYSPQA